jgi:hypothetical protein
VVLAVILTMVLITIALNLFFKELLSNPIGRSNVVLGQHPYLWKASLGGLDVVPR